MALPGNFNGPQPPMLDPMGGSGLSDIASKLQLSNQLMGKLVGIISNLFPRGMGNFSLTAASSKVVTDANVTSVSYVVLIPTNAAAGTLIGSNKSLYISYASGSFTVATASGASATGGETFQYLVFNAL